MRENSGQKELTLPAWSHALNHNSTPPNTRKIKTPEQISATFYSQAAKKPVLAFRKATDGPKLGFNIKMRK
jgi:hypothetical protein